MISALSLCDPPPEVEAAGPGGAQEPAVQIVIYRPQFRTEIERDGITKTVEIVLSRDEAGLTRHITAIDGNQFAVKRSETASPPPATYWALKPVVPMFLPGDTDIRIKVDPGVGFTEFLNLKIHDPAVVAVATDWTVLADREGVRATLFLGTVESSRCKHWLGGVSLDPPVRRAPDGSWFWVTGDILTCEVVMQGSDGGAYVTRRIVEGGKPRFVFARLRE